MILPSAMRLMLMPVIVNFLPVGANVISLPEGSGKSRSSPVCEFEAVAYFVSFGYDVVVGFVEIREGVPEHCFEFFEFFQTLQLKCGVTVVW